MRRTALLLPLLVGCNRDVKTPFPAGLEPLEANRASFPDGEGYPEALSCREGEDEEEDIGTYTWVHCKGYVNAPIDDVYAAYQTPRVVADRRAIDDLSVEWDVEPEYDVSFLLHNTVDAAITVEFDVTWRHGDVDGDPEVVEELGTRWQKTYGSEVIDLLRGSIRTTRVDADNTALEIVFHQRSLQDDSPIMHAYLDDLFADIRASVRGNELPAYDSGV